MAEVIVGIDLGTTNSEIAAYLDGKPRIIGNGDQLMLPSCVALSPAGDLLIGEPARNQMLLYPERTVRSVKRLMGSGERVKLGDREFSPQEISAIILRELAGWAQRRLGEPIRKAVVTVPAYFSDAQRNATREAGELAGLEVVRIVNEPTAASLAYGMDAQGRKTVMVYDLGGGTLDVSVVRVEGEVTEVLASHGNNQLGGDDFDRKLVDHLADVFRRQSGIDVRDRHPAAYARLWWASEAAKKQLSYEPYARILEEGLVHVEGTPRHLDIEISRREYEAMIRPLVEQTLESASKALTDAGLTATSLDEVLLVGGSTRTPLVVEMLQQMCGKPPRQDLHPDLCVALGAGVLASRLEGHDVERVLVDVSPFSFGPSYLGIRDGYEYPHCYHPVIKRNTPLPVTRTEEYSTAADYQTVVEVDIYQGENHDALKNVHVGHFRIEGLAEVEGPNPVLCRMRLDLDGILHVTAIEKRTGLSKHVAISGATRRRDSTDLARGRDELNRLFERRVTVEDPQELTQAVAPIEGARTDAFGSLVSPVGEPVSPAATAETATQTETAARDATAPATAEAPPAAAPPGLTRAAADAGALVARCRGRMADMHPDDQEEALGLIEDVDNAINAQDEEALASASKALSEFLFFVEGR